MVKPELPCRRQAWAWRCHAEPRLWVLIIQRSETGSAFTHSNSVGHQHGPNHERLPGNNGTPSSSLYAANRPLHSAPIWSRPALLHQGLSGDYQRSHLRYHAQRQGSARWVFLRHIWSLSSPPHDNYRSLTPAKWHIHSVAPHPQPLYSLLGLTCCWLGLIFHWHSPLLWPSNGDMRISQPGATTGRSSSSWFN